MTHTLVFSILGPDRPGLVEILAQTVQEHQGNWLESRMAHLGGQFAGIVRVSAPAEQLRSLESALTKLQNTNDLAVSLQKESVLQTEQSTGQQMKLSLVGADRPGIVRQITQTLAEHGCNVEEFSSEVTSAPMTGEPLFHATLAVLFPTSVATGLVQVALERIAADLMVEIDTSQL
jgi:glycine cleavage system regulatory protein